ncbi:ABC transporter permease [Sporosarcina limicola]|nr:ABC transporter permease [Sporosarcina limicola]
MVLTRFRNEWKSIVCWLLLPIVMTLLVMKSVGVWQEETKVPIALVVQEETQLAKQLVDEIVNTELLHVHFMVLDEALHKLEQHELDSVFVIREGYEESVLSNRRNQLIEAYSSNQSFAYQAVVETITSLAQQDVARSKASFVIKQLFVDYGRESEWDYGEIIGKSHERQQNEALLRTSFSYYDKEETSNDSTAPLLQVWGVWTLFAMITTFFLFDWMLKENRPSMRPRWLFTAISFRRYALGMLLFYTAILFSVDVLTAFIFLALFDEAVTIRILLSLYAFRLTVNVLAFLLASVYRQLFMYYVSGIAIALFLIVIGGAILPLDGLMRKWPWIELLSPVQSLLTGSIPIGWLIALSTLLVLWMWKGGKTIA